MRPLYVFSSAGQGFGIAAPHMAAGELCDDGGIHLASPSFLADATNHL
jgi:hypothetical protein